MMLLDSCLLFGPPCTLFCFDRKCAADGWFSTDIELINNSQHANNNHRLVLIIEPT